MPLPSSAPATAGRAARCSTGSRPCRARRAGARRVRLLVQPALRRRRRLLPRRGRSRPTPARSGPRSMPLPPPIRITPPTPISPTAAATSGPGRRTGPRPRAPGCGRSSTSGRQSGAVPRRRCSRSSARRSAARRACRGCACSRGRRCRSGRSTPIPAAGPLLVEIYCRTFAADAGVRGKIRDRSVARYGARPPRQRPGRRAADVQRPCRRRADLGRRDAPRRRRPRDVAPRRARRRPRDRGLDFRRGVRRQPRLDTRPS